jgi:DHA1 family tetracycline resistance protein-like MFS transporter
MPALLLISAFLEGIALTLIQGYLPLYVREALGETRFLTVGLVIVVPALGTVLASNFWGGVSDVSGKLKPLILVGLAGYVVALAGIPLFLQGTSVLLYVGATALLYGCVAPLLKAYATRSMPDRPQHALSYVLMAQAAGWFVGGLEGGRLMEAGIGTGLHQALRITAALIGVHIILAALWLHERPRPPAVPRPRVGWVTRLAEDLVALYENPRLFRLCVISFFLFAANFTMWGFFTVYFVEHLGASVRLLRYTLGFAAVAGVVMYLFIGPLVKRFGARGILATGILLYAGMYLLMGLQQGSIATAIIFIAPLFGLTTVAANTLATEYSSESQRGGGLGILNGTMALATIAGPMLGGSLADVWGLRVIPWTAFGFVAVAAPLALALVWSHRTPQQAGAAAAGNAAVTEAPQTTEDGRIAD